MYSALKFSFITLNEIRSRGLTAFGGLKSEFTLANSAERYLYLSWNQFNSLRESSCFNKSLCGSESTVLRSWDCLEHTNKTQTTLGTSSLLFIIHRVISDRSA